MKPRIRKLSTTLAGILLLVGLCSAPILMADAVMDPAKASLFVDAAWLKANLPKVVVVDARPEKAFQGGHIPGAVSAPWQKFADMRGKPGDPGWGVLLPKDQLSAKIGALGIDGRKPVIVYAEPPGWGEDGRFAWMARVAGIPDVKILDGGFEAWKKSGGETSTDKAAASNQSYALSTLDDGLTATTDWIKTRIGRIKIVDSRTKKEFDGATDYKEARGGHLPGATLIAFEDMFKKDYTVKNIPELKQMFQAAGLKPEDEIVTYCTAGIRSAHMALMLRMAGFEKARNYDASFYEWAGMEQLPLEK
jgi:thiosulfate/3-mercaptopyruvate sulfurtransferase